MNRLSRIAAVTGDAYARLLGAIAIQESDFENRNQREGPARGVFQIEPTTYGISEADAEDLTKAAAAIKTNLSKYEAGITAAMTQVGYSPSDRRYAVFAALARIHNRGNGGVVHFDKAGTPSLGKLLTGQLDSGEWGFSSLDNAGGKVDKRYRESAHGNYVRNVMDIFSNCLDGFVGIP